MSVRELPEGYRARYGYADERIPFKYPVSGRWRAEREGWRRVVNVDIKDPSGRVVATGKAICNPEDQYNKKFGRRIALGRALKQMERSGVGRTSWSEVKDRRRRVDDEVPREHPGLGNVWGVSVDYEKISAELSSLLRKFFDEAIRKLSE